MSTRNFKHKIPKMKIENNFPISLSNMIFKKKVGKQILNKFKIVFINEIKSYNFKQKYQKLFPYRF